MPQTQFPTQFVIFLFFSKTHKEYCSHSAKAIQVSGTCIYFFFFSNLLLPQSIFLLLMIQLKMRYKKDFFLQFNVKHQPSRRHEISAIDIYFVRAIMRLTFIYMNYLEFSLILETWLTHFPSSENVFQVSSTEPLGRRMFYAMFYSKEVVWHHHLKLQINK